MIVPTVGRVVWVWTDGADFHAQVAPKLLSPEQPMVGLVSFVRSERLINVAGFDHVGLPFALTEVPLLQDEDPIPERGTYAGWMPYQKAVASGQIAPTLHATPEDAAAANRQQASNESASER